MEDCGFRVRVEVQVSGTSVAKLGQVVMLAAVFAVSAPVEGPCADPLARYRAEYAGTSMPADWRYQWNQGAIGDTNSYTNLLWDTTRGIWTPDGSTFEVPPHYYLYVYGAGMHPGDSAVPQRYAIAGRKLTGYSGPVFVTSSFLLLNSLSGGIDFRIYVGTNPIHAITLQGADDARTNSLDCFLGQAQAGDTVYVAIGPGSDYFFDGASLDFALSSAPLPGRRPGGSGIVAGYATDFQTGRPKPGWMYMVNTDGAMGNPAGYFPMQWDGIRYEINVKADFPNPVPYSWLSLHGTGGHPGAGAGQGGSPVDRYAIAAYVVKREGRYSLTNASLTMADIGSVDLMVHVGTNAPVAILDNITQAGGPAAFDVDLGRLAEGDTIYVGAGPNGSESFDSFTWDFSIFARINQGTTILIR